MVDKRFGWFRLATHKAKAHYYQSGYPVCGNVYVKNNKRLHKLLPYTGPVNGRCTSCRYIHMSLAPAIGQIRKPVINVDRTNDILPTAPDETIPHGEYTVADFVSALNRIPGQGGVWSYDARHRRFIFDPLFKLIWSSTWEE